MHQCPKCKVSTQYTPVCRACAPSLFAVRISTSPIHGLGLFATKSLGPGELVIPYHGDILDYAEVCEKYPHGGDYLLECSCLGQSFFVNADSEKGWTGLGGLANHDANPNSELAFVDVDSQIDQPFMFPIWIRAAHTIPEGAEITVHYGTTYRWKHKSGSE